MHTGLVSCFHSPSNSDMDYRIFNVHIYIYLFACVYTRRTSGYSLNPFTAPACKISGLKDVRSRLLTVYFFRSYNVYFQCCVSITILSQDSAKNKAKTVQSFKFCTFLVVFKWHYGNEGVNSGFRDDDEEVMLNAIYILGTS